MRQISPFVIRFNEGLKLKSSTSLLSYGGNLTPPHSLFSFLCTYFVTDCYFYFPLLQWDILCDEAKKYVPLTKTIFYAGKLFGAYFFGWVSDRYGRRMTLLIAMLVQFLASFIESFSVNFVMYVVLRVPLGICSGGKLDVEISLFLFGNLLIQHALQIECVRSCDQKPYLHNETNGGICIISKKIFQSSKMAALSLFTPPAWPPWRHVNTLYW